MKRFLVILVALLAMAMLFVSCSEDPATEPDTESKLYIGTWSREFDYNDDDVMDVVKTYEVKEDGTFTITHEPLDNPDKKESYSGTYTVHDGLISLSISGDLAYDAVGYSKDEIVYIFIEESGDETYLLKKDEETFTEGDAIKGKFVVVYDAEAKTYTFSDSDVYEGTYYTSETQYAIADEGKFSIYYFDGVGPTEETTVCSESATISATCELPGGEGDQWSYKLTITGATSTMVTVFSVEGDKLSIYEGSTTPIVYTRVSEK